MKKSEETMSRKSRQKVKPFLVRLHCVEHRIAYEQYCEDNDRNMDSQARFLITKELKLQGYI